MERHTQLVEIPLDEIRLVIEAALPVANDILTGGFWIDRRRDSLLVEVDLDSHPINLWHTEPQIGYEARDVDFSLRRVGSLAVTLDGCTD